MVTVPYVSINPSKKREVQVVLMYTQNMFNYLIGQMINGYSIIEVVGNGGNATVFRCKKENNIYAIKVISGAIGKSKIKRFKLETQFLKSCETPYIVKYIDNGVFEYFDSLNNKRDSFYYLVMPIFSCNFNDVLKDKSFSVETKIKLFLDACRGIGYAHEKGVIHRDIKPENILVDKNTMSACLTDFGIAHFKNVSNLTKKKDRMANYLYAAPEQREIIHEIVSKATDNYAFGLMLNRIFTGKVPFGDNYLKIIEKNQSLFELDNVVSSLIKNNPSERVQNIQFVISDVERIMNEYKYIEDEVKRLSLYKGRKNKRIESIAIRDMAFVYNAVRKSLYLKNVSYNFHDNIKYTLSKDFLNTLFVEKKLSELVSRKRQYDRRTWEKIKRLSKAKVNQRNKLLKFFNSLTVFADFDYIKKDCVDLAYHLTDYHFNELLEEIKREYKDYVDTYSTVTINHYYALLSEMCEKHEWFSFYDFYSLYYIDYSKSNTVVDNKSFFISKNKKSEEELLNSFFEKYGIIIRKNYDKNLEGYLVSADTWQYFAQLINDLEIIRDTKFKDGDVRIIDVEDLIDKLNKFDSYPEIQKNSTIIDGYELSLMLNHLL